MASGNEDDQAPGYIRYANWTGCTQPAEDAQVQLEPGDTIIYYTDGFTDV